MEYIILSGSLEQANLLITNNKLRNENYYVITKEDISKLNQIIDSRLTYIEVNAKGLQEIDDIHDYIRNKRNNHKEYLLRKDYSYFEKLNHILNKSLNISSYKEVCYKLQKKVTDSGYTIDNNIRNSKIEIIYNYFTLLYLSNFGFANSLDIAKYLYEEGELNNTIININNLVLDLQDTILHGINKSILNELLEKECLSYGNI